MAERGEQFLGAAVMYESDVVANGNGQIVPIYPLEGTFVAGHPGLPEGRPGSQKLVKRRGCSGIIC